jgi:hypothetical protein
VVVVVVEEDVYGMIRQNTHRDMYNFPGHSKIVYGLCQCSRPNYCHFAAVWSLSQVTYAAHLLLVVECKVVSLCAQMYSAKQSAHLKYFSKVYVMETVSCTKKKHPRQQYNMKGTKKIVFLG